MALRELNNIGLKMSDEIKQVIVVRKDLNMRKGKIAAQAAHASMKVFFDRIEYCDHGEMKMNNITPEMEKWINGLFTKVVVGIENDVELYKIWTLAVASGIPTAKITDAGKTEFQGNPTFTCIAIGPDKAEKIDKLTGDLKLL